MLRALTLCLALILLAACGSDTELPDGEFLTPGGLYRVTDVGTNEANGEVLYSVSSEIRLTRRADREALGDLRDLIRMDAEEVGTDRRMSVWYQVRPDGLYEVANSWGNIPYGSAHPRPAEPGPSALDGLRLALGVSADSLHVREQPRLLYPIPMRVESEWMEFDMGFLRRDSRVTAQERVRVASGRYDVLVIDTEVDGGFAEGAYVDTRSYVEPVYGMVLREETSRFELIDELGERIGWWRSTARIERIGP